MAKVIVKILKPLVGKSSHHIQSTSDFVSKVREVTLLPGECLSSYDVTALFISVPIDPALNIVKDPLEQDHTLSNSTVLSVKNIIEHLGFCLHITYFSFQNKFNEQVEGVAMGSLVSPIAPNLYMEHFEGELLGLPLICPGFGIGLWMTLGSSSNRPIRNFVDHINNIDQSIKFTVKGNQENRTIPFLHTLVKPEAESYLSIKVYHKPNHTDQYLQWDSHHNPSAKYSVIGTLTHRAKTVCTTLGLLNEELQHFKEALVSCKYPRWAINKVQNKVINGNQEDNGSTHAGNTSQDTNVCSGNSQTSTTLRGRPNMGHMVIPHVQGLGESITFTCTKYGIQTYLAVTGPSNRCWSDQRTRTPRKKVQ